MVGYVEDKILFGPFEAAVVYVNYASLGYHLQRCIPPTSSIIIEISSSHFSSGKSSMLSFSCTRKSVSPNLRGATPTPGTIQLDPDRWTIYPERAALEYYHIIRRHAEKSLGWKVVVMQGLIFVDEIESQNSLEGCGEGPVRRVTMSILLRGESTTEKQRS
jgi:hypothetical protein